MGLFDRTLRARREELGLGQSQLAERIGVTQQTISRWESGEIVPPPKRLTTLAQALNLDSNRMLSYAGYLDSEADDRTWDLLTVFYELLGDLPDDDLLLIIQRAAEEIRSRQPAASDGWTG